MVDAIISAVVEDLTSVLLSSIKEEVKLVTGVNVEVKKLVSNLKSIQALLDDAEEQQLKEASVENWLFNLKAVSYDMDDVLDEWKTWIQTSQLQRQHHSSGSDQNHFKHKVLSIFRRICFIKRDVGLRHVVARKIREIQQRLDNIKAPHHLNSTNISDKPIERYVTTSFVDTQKVKGRDEEKDEVKSMILNPKSKPHVISLVGMGGIGKTTLAKLIYNDGEINTHFEKKIWVCVSDPFDEMRIAKAILESLSDSSTAQNFKELDKVLKKIHADLNEKKFLLVLDDVWNESHSKWKELEQFLICGSLGSTILITTRKKKVAEVMGCDLESIHNVGLLTPEECWSIISQIVGDCQKLESIGRRIADKCKGLPLAATTIGGLLRFKKSEKEWLRVLEKKEWEDEDILGPLKLSYYDLPLPLKQCFKYCAIFPKDSIIEKRRLIEKWIAQGYLKGKENDEDLEMVGEIYFDNLVARSLLQISSYGNDYYVLHDIVSDLAQTFTKNECLMIEVLKDKELNGNSLHADANVCHLTLTIENDASFPMSIYGFNKLRTLIIQFVRNVSPQTIVELEGIFDHLTCLRALNLRFCDIKKVPYSINRLFHLRWLDLSRNINLEKLPETLCECYNLQTLILENCENLVELPQGIGKLINLMYLNFEYCKKIVYLPKGIGNLWHLRRLTCLIISVNKGESFSIVEMEKLNNLRGRLEIRGLGNVRKPEEARKAQLKKRKSVTKLSLSFGRDDVQEDRGDVGEDEEELLEALEPPSNLEVLSIVMYRGKTLFPSWMMKLNLLRKLMIEESRNCEELPSLGKLPCLEELELSAMRVKRVGVEFMGIEKEKDATTPFLSFPKLKKLSFESFWGWKEWDDIDEWLMERINNKTITIIPCLQRLTISDCPKLKTFPYRLMSLNLLKVLRIECTNYEELPSLGKLLCLEELFLSGMRVKRVSIEFMGIEKEKDASTSFLSFPKLKKLEFWKFEKWEEWDDIDEWLMERITNKTITIMPSLQALQISACSELKTFPYRLMSLNLLKVLRIECTNYEELPPLGKLLCLEELFLSGMRVKRVGVEFMGIEKEKDASTSFLSFLKLKKLEFQWFEEWEEWDDIDEWLMERINNKTITIMPSLQALQISACSKLEDFPYRLMSLNLLKVLRIECTNYEELPPLGKLPCLEELFLSGMGVKRVGVEFMGIEEEKDASTFFLSFPKLKILSFYAFKKWKEWDDINEWLIERINNKTITIMPSLQELIIRFCPKLKTLPYHLLSPTITTRLQKLIIYRCDVLEEEIQKDKLSHISHLEISPASGEWSKIDQQLQLPPRCSSYSITIFGADF